MRHEVLWRSIERYASRDRGVGGAEERQQGEGSVSAPLFGRTVQSDRRQGGPGKYLKI